MNLQQIKIENMHGVNRTYDLKKLNYFVGPNGAGKSTILQAIQLALLGYIPGYDKNKSAIFQHASAPHMSVTLTLTDESNVIRLKRSWSQKGKDIVASAELPDNFEVENFMGGLDLPIFNFADFIGLSANKLKDWFINFLPATTTEVDWDKELRQSIDGFGKILDPSYVDDTIKRAKTTATGGVEGIRMLNTLLKASLSEKKAEHTRIQNTISSLIHYDGCDASQDEAALRAELEAKNARMLVISGDICKGDNQAALIKKLKSCEVQAPAASLQEDPRYQAAYNSLKQVSSEKLNELRNEIDNSNKMIGELQATIKYNNQVLQGNGVCTYTKKTCDAITSMFARIEADNNGLIQQVEELQSKIQSLTCEQRQLMQEQSTAEQQIRTLQMTYADKDRAAESLKATGDQLYDVEALNKESEQLRVEVHQLNEQITQIVANKQYEQLQGKLTAEMYATQQIIEMLKVWIKLTDVNGIQSNMMVAPFMVLSDYMTEDIQSLFGNKQYSANFNLSEKANSFNFGINKGDDAYVPYGLLSSGEKCLFVFALFSSLLRSIQVPLSMILVDDLLDHLDDTHIQSLFNYLRNSDTLQVIIAGVKPCTHENADEFVVEV